MKIFTVREVIVALLVEWLLPIPEVYSLNPVIDKKFIEHWFTCLNINCIEKTKINQKRPRIAHF